MSLHVTCDIQLLSILCGNNYGIDLEQFPQQSGGLTWWWPGGLNKKLSSLNNQSSQAMKKDTAPIFEEKRQVEYFSTSLGD